MIFLKLCHFDCNRFSDPVHLLLYLTALLFSTKLAMEQFSFFLPNNILSVSQLTTYLRGLLESDEILQDVWVEGEISNFSRPSSGHLYFTLKDQDAAVRCVMWRNAAMRLGFLSEGRPRRAGARQYERLRGQRPGSALCRYHETCRGRRALPGIPAVESQTGSGRSL